jgi:2-haloacid dehalogenase
MNQTPDHDRVIVFDLGAVLIDWDPRHMYRKLFDNEADMESFLSEVATLEWNAQHDAGVRWKDGVAQLIAEHPEHADLITAYWKRWDEMLNGPIEGTVEILRRLKDAGHEVHALTNWSNETFPIARARYDFLDLFDSIVVSGEERVMKPDHRIYRILLDRIGRSATECIFVDDTAKNIQAAAELGFDTIRFVDSEHLRQELVSRGLLN